MKPETGYLFFSSIAKTPESYLLMILSNHTYALNILVAEYVTRMVPIGTHEWDKFIDPEEVENILAPLGFQTVAKAGTMVTNPLTMEMNEFPNWLRGNYMMLFKRLM